MTRWSGSVGVGANQLKLRNFIKDTNASGL